MTPTLNWKELEIYVDSIRSMVEGRWIERVIIPSRTSFPDRYLKNEWAFCLHAHQKTSTLVWSVRSGWPYLAWTPNRPFLHASHATQSPFGLFLSKNLRSCKIISLKTLPRDRCIWMELSHPMILVLKLIPAQTEAYLLDASESHPEKGWPILARSRSHSENLDERFRIPDSSRAPETMPIRSEWIQSPLAYFETTENLLRAEALTLRWQTALRALEKNNKFLIQTERSLNEKLKNTQNEPDWKHYGTLLKSVFHAPPPLQKGHRSVWDFESQQNVDIPCDPKLTLAEQVDRFFQLARKKGKRLEETSLRLNEILSRKSKFEHFDSKSQPSWKALTELESLLGISQDDLPMGQKKAKIDAPTLGRRFVSQEKLEIWVGKTEKENLELTFRKAKGNDLWLHVKGRPSAHAVILLPSGKSASLETLLDAANLILHYSGYVQESKSEVDYTLRKYVKKIKNTTQVSYVQNKTLIVQYDPKRIGRLFLSNPHST